MIGFQVEGMNCQHGAVVAANAVQAIQVVEAGARMRVKEQSGRAQIESNFNSEHLGTAIIEADCTVKGVTPSAADGT